MRFLLLFLGLLLAVTACQTAPTPQPTTAAVTTAPQPLATLTPSRAPTTQPTATATTTAEAVSSTTSAASAPATPTAVPTITTAAAAPSPSPQSPVASPQSSTTGIDPATLGPGSLIQLEMTSIVGVLLDEYPAETRDRVAAELANQPESVWLSRALQQIDLTYNRLHFRDFVYRREGITTRLQLPHPPRDLWEVSFNPAGAERQTIDGHELVVWEYTFTSILLSDEASAELAEPNLGQIGGVWEEPFVLPVDPSLLLQRTGNACINEAGFPPNSYDSENVASFYDYTCSAESTGMAGCHRNIVPTLSCTQALRTWVGTTSTTMRFERLPWDEATADTVRRGQLTTTIGPDLTVVGEELNNHRLVYRYFGPDDCAYGEGNVGGTGWRRLLMFDAMAHNVGAVSMHIGSVEGENETNIFEYDPCHNHIHYSNYGEFSFGIDPYPNKRAFCVESTGRLSNNEGSPLTHSYSCRIQGIQAGWVDEYGAGLDGQWIDVTEAVPTDTLDIEPIVLPLTFRMNTDQFLCEGEPVLDESGQQQYAWSGLYNSRGLPMAYPVCELIPDWDGNNVGSVLVTLPPTGSFVTQPCANGETGPLRNCGFVPDADDLVCTAGQQVQMSCQLNTTSSSSTAAPQVLRLCESSAVLGTGTACTYQDALANLIIGRAPVDVTFTCPRPRTAEEPGGLYALYTAPAFSDDESTSVSCVVE